MAGDVTLDGPGSTALIDIFLDEASGGISGFNITAELDNPGIAEIVEVSYPSWATISENSTLPSDSCWIMAVDLQEEVEANSTDILLATITVRGDSAGSTNLLVSSVQMDADTGDPISTDPAGAVITVEGSITPPPTDTGIEVVLGEGWSIFSTPVMLEPQNATLMAIFDAGAQQAIRTILIWDGASWIIPDGNYILKPLDAVYLMVQEGSSVTAVLVPFSGVSAPPQKQLVSGLNLIGPAPYHDDSGFIAIPLDQMLISVEEAPGGIMGYSIVISPAHGQQAWSYARGGTVREMLPYKGYWVVMENPDTLFGFSTTPI